MSVSICSYRHAVERGPRSKASKLEQGPQPAVVDPVRGCLIDGHAVYQM
jgi:hypothetical protein